MLAEQSLKDGKLQDALTQLQDQVRKDPSSPKHRIFLFQLLAVLGQWDRALTQLNVVGDLDAGSQAMVQTYRQALRCEVLRADIFVGKRSPLIFGDPEHWLALLTEALRLTAQGQYAQAAELRERAFEQAPASAGRIDGQPFQWLADADPRLGPVLEAIINGRYYWIPVHRVRSLVIEEPADLRDMVWLPAQFMWANGGETVGLIPTRYPASESSGDPLIQLARKTDWEEHEAGVWLGLGQRMLATDQDEYSLLNVRHVELTAQEDAGTVDG